MLLRHGGGRNGAVVERRKLRPTGLNPIWHRCPAAAGSRWRRAAAPATGRLVARHGHVVQADAPAVRGAPEAEKSLFVVDGDDLRVYVYRIGHSRAAASDFDLDPDNSIPKGIAHAEGLLYVVDSDEKVYAYRIDGARDERSDFAPGCGRRRPA